MPKLLYALAALVVFRAASLAQTSSDSCDASPEERKIHADMSKSAQPVELLRKELQANPDSLFLNRWLIENKATPIGSLADEYRKKLDAHPGSALYLYLYGRSLLGANTPEAVQQLNLAVAADPKLPWSYYALADVYSSANFKDSNKLTDNVLAFTRLCPDVLSGYKFLRFVEDREKLRALAAQFRRAIEDQNTKGVVGNYPGLWAAEFRAADPSAFDELRKRVAKDIERMKQLNPNNTEALREGYRLIGDSAAADAIPQKPRVPKTFSEVYMAWDKDHPYPKDDASPEEKDQFNRQLLGMCEQWVKDWPDDASAWGWLLSSLDRVNGASNEQLEKAGEMVLDVSRKHPFKGYMFFPYSGQVAEIWNKRNIRLEECIRLAEEAIAEIDRGPTFMKPNSDLRRDASEDFMKQHERSVAQGRFRALGIEADAARKLKNFEKASAAIGQMKKWLDENPQDAPFLNYTYFRQSALLAEVQGRKLDALAYYQRMFGGYSPAPEDKQQVLALWKQMGGTEDTFALWSSPGKPTVAEQPSAWTDVNRPLRALNAADLDGRKWTVADLRGKTTLINVWATWCTPCREELPDLQKLYDQVKDRKDVQVVSISVDENPGKIVPLLKEQHYTFPVILGQSFVSDLVGETPIPRTWIVDSNGTARLERIGYSRADWPQEMIQKLTTLK